MSEKKEKLKVKDKEKKLKTRKLKNPKLLILIGAIVIVVIAIVIAAYFLINHFKYEKYKPYEAKMITYGIADVYHNKSPKSSEKVTKGEAIKVIIAATLNTSDISNYVTTDETYQDAQWIEYAKSKVIFKNDEVNRNNMNDRISYIDVIEYLANAKSKILDKELDRTVEPLFKDYQNYDNYEKQAIMDMVSNDILANIDNKLDGNRKIAKGELNELIIKFVEKYMIISNGHAIVTDPEKLPSNIEEYPFVVEGVDKEVYEQPFYVNYSVQAASPKIVYKFERDGVSRLQKIVEDYYSVILNVDYNTINKDTFKARLYETTVSEPIDEEVEAYVNYVKTHKIKMSGKATIQVPAIYSDGYFLNVRTKLEFKIESADTNKDLLYLDLTDLQNDYMYDKKDYTIYIDTKMSNSAFSLIPFNESSIISKITLDMSKDEIKSQKVGD